MPVDWDYEFTEASIKNVMEDGGTQYINLNSKYHANLTFSDMSEDDLTHFTYLKTYGWPFYLYPCGGRTDIANIGFRPQDIYLCNYINPVKPKLRGGLFGIGSEITIEVAEV